MNEAHAAQNFKPAGFLLPSRFIPSLKLPNPFTNPPPSAGPGTDEPRLKRQLTKLIYSYMVTE